MKTPRTAQIERRTGETSIQVRLNLDEPGPAEVETAIGFFDHLLEQVGKHGLISLVVQAQGDLEVDGHHTVEDVGLALGQAFKEALGTKEGIRRYGSCDLPMDEALARVALDLSGRPYLVLKAEFPQERVGWFDTCLVKEFLQAFCTSGGITLHVEVCGENSHHMIEALFKALGRSLRQAVEHDLRVSGVPSTKGVLV